MKKTLLLLCVLTAMQAHANQEFSKRNLTERALTLKENEILVGGAVGYGKTNSRDAWFLGLNGAWGVTDDLSLGLGHLRYRFIDRANDRDGLELTFGAGLKGAYERNDDTVLGYGADVTGQYVFSPSLALTFGVDYVFWNDVGRQNADEYRFSIGSKHRLQDNVTMITNLAYRDLKDMQQDDAYEASLAFNYSLSPQTDIGVAFSYTDFDAEREGLEFDSELEKAAAVYIAYRF